MINLKFINPPEFCEKYKNCYKIKDRKKSYCKKFGSIKSIFYKKRTCIFFENNN